MTDNKKKVVDDKPKRTTLYVAPSKYDKLKAIAYWDRTTVTDLTDKAFSEFLERYEKQNGVVKPIP